MDNMKRMRCILLCAPLALAACGDGREAEPVNTADGAAAVMDSALSPADKLAAATDQSWINLSGTVVTAGPRSFVLDYGAGTITVEMDDWDWYREGRALVAGDPVVVTGKVDDDLWQARRIEAASVFVRNLNTYFYASGADEEELAESSVYVVGGPTYGDSTGYVTNVEGREFTIGTGGGQVRVDTSGLTGKNEPKVQVGDRVYVWGDLDLESGERTEIMARGVVKLTRDRIKGTRSAGSGHSEPAGADAEADNPSAQGNRQ